MRLISGWLTVAALAFSQVQAQKTAPAPYGALPDKRQLKVLEMEMYCIMHFTPTTFQNKEWGFGDASPSIFAPRKFDAAQIVNAVKAGGFKGITVVAKHHDGFCLWPTKTTPYNISESPFRNGEGDLVREMATALRKEGLQLGLYCSPWDRNNPEYARPEYVKEVYYPQLKELYTRYGPLFTVFFDGANGGDGYYGASNEKRSINASEYYRFDSIWQMVRVLQPTANIFSDIGPDLRWVGNEKGEAAETSWATLTPVTREAGKKPAPGFVDDAILPGGTRNGQFFIPAECDVPMRPGWFFHADQEDKVKTPAQLLDIYYASVGRGGTLDLGISPNTDGLLSKGDVEKLAAFGKILQETFSTNLAKGARLTASNIRGKQAIYNPQQLLDNDRYSYWATDDSVIHPELLIELSKPATFNVIRLRENIQLGQRIDSVAIDVLTDGGYTQIATATSIGANRLIRLPENITAKKLRLRILGSPVCIALSDFGLYAEPQPAPDKNIPRREPKKQLQKLLTEGMITSGEMGKATDSDPATFWESESLEQPLQVYFVKPVTIQSFFYLPRQDAKKSGIIDQYAFYTSTNGKDWTLAAEGEFSNIVNNPIEQTVTLPKPVQASYFKLVAKRVVEGNKAVVAEVGIVEAGRK